MGNKKLRAHELTKATRATQLTPVQRRLGGRRRRRAASAARTTSVRKTNGLWQTVPGARPGSLGLETFLERLGLDRLVSCTFAGSPSCHDPVAVSLVPRSTDIRHIR
jgi:hypothetical protein